MTEWQDISTAPKDGNEFLAIDAETGFAQVVDYSPRTNDDTFVWAVSDGSTYREDAFSHWMPLPPPPEINQ